LTVVAKEGARILLEPGGSGCTVGSNYSCRFEGLNPGRYQVSAKLTGHEDVASKGGKQEVMLAANESETVEFKLQPIIYSLTLEPNAQIAEEPLTSNYWTKPEDWEIPTGWKIVGKKLVANGVGVLLPRDRKRHCYTNFKLFATFKMDNDVAASFVVRAQDKQNYYLIQVTGGKADLPYKLHGFVIKDGLRTPFPNGPFTVPVKDHNYLSANGENPAWPELTIECAGNKFTVYLGDSEQPDATLLGVLEDTKNYFPFGAPGIAVRSHEQQEIERFVATPTPGKQEVSNTIVRQHDK
jgi:hypothetical protein